MYANAANTTHPNITNTKVLSIPVFGKLLLYVLVFVFAVFVVFVVFVVPVVVIVFVVPVVVVDPLVVPGNVDIGFAADDERF